MARERGDVLMIELLATIFSAVRIIRAKDSFNRSNGPLGTPDIGIAWTTGYGSVSIVSQKAKGGSSGANGAFMLMAIPNNYEISADIVWNSTETVSLIGRSASAADDNHMRLRYDGTNLTIFRKISGTQVTLAEQAYSWSSGATHNMAFNCNENTFRAFIDGALIVSVTDDNATKYNSYFGFALYKPSVTPAATLDNLLVQG